MLCKVVDVKKIRIRPTSKDFRRLKKKRLLFFPSPQRYLYVLYVDLVVSFSGSYCYALLEVFSITYYKNHIASGDNYIMLAIKSHLFHGTLASHLNVNALLTAY